MRKERERELKSDKKKKRSEEFEPVTVFFFWDQFLELIPFVRLFL